MKPTGVAIVASFVVGAASGGTAAAQVPHQLFNKTVTFSYTVQSMQRDPHGRTHGVQTGINNTEWPVNRSVATFISSIEAFHSAFAALPPCLGLNSVLAAAERIDPEAFNAPDGYWSTWVEEFGD